MKKRLSKVSSLFIILVIYIAAIFAGIAVNNAFKDKGLLISVFLADAAATFVVWLFGIMLKNSSVYDPYWSAAPLIIVPYWIISKAAPLTSADYMLLLVFAVWGVRLTLNWAAGWRGMEHEDWRYVMYREKSGRLWHIVNFGGINMMPTVLVYLGMVPAYYIIFNQSSVNIVFYIGFAIALLSPMIQLAADTQMTAHRDSSISAHIETGLWRYSRHPNYFGEVSFWWGIFIMQMGTAPDFLFSCAGALLITLLFLFISIPMMEKHVSERHEGYDEYKSKVSILVPWFRRP